MPSGAVHQREAARRVCDSTSGSSGRVAAAPSKNLNDGFSHIIRNVPARPDNQPPIRISLQIINGLRRKELRDAPLLRCSRVSKPVDCCLCERRILPGEMYRHGGMERLAHDSCVQPAREAYLNNFL